MRAAFGLYGTAMPVRAGRRAELVFRTPARHSRPLDEQALLINARPLTLEFEGLSLTGYLWQPRAGDLELPPVLLQHGWESRASQLAPLVRVLLAAGHRVVAFDAPAHGDSQGAVATVSSFADMVLAIDRAQGPFHAAIGHSVGGAAVLSATVRGLRTQRVATLAAPASLRRAALRFAAMIGLPQRAWPALLEAVAIANGRSLDELEFALQRPPAGVQALLFHDPRDWQVPAAESAAMAGAWPQARLRQVAGVGHNGILAAGSVHGLLLEFLAPAAREDATAPSPKLALAS